MYSTCTSQRLTKHLHPNSADVDWRCQTHAYATTYPNARCRSSFSCTNPTNRCRCRCMLSRLATSSTPRHTHMGRHGSPASAKPAVMDRASEAMCKEHTQAATGPSWLLDIGLHLSCCPASSIGGSLSWCCRLCKCCLEGSAYGSHGAGFSRQTRACTYTCHAN